MNKILKLRGFEPSRLRQEATAPWHGGGEGVRTLRGRLISTVVGDYNDYINECFKKMCLMKLTCDPPKWV